MPVTIGYFIKIIGMSSTEFSFGAKKKFSNKCTRTITTENNLVGFSLLHMYRKEFFN